MSSEIYELMKRSDEAHVVEKAHRRPRFVEDCVREMIRGVIERVPAAERRGVRLGPAGEPRDDPSAQRRGRALRDARPRSGASCDDGNPAGRAHQRARPGSTRSSPETRRREDRCAPSSSSARASPAADHAPRPRARARAAAPEHQGLRRVPHRPAPARPEIEATKLPVVLGHQIVATTEDGRRVGVPWLGWTDGSATTAARTERTCASTVASPGATSTAATRS